MSSPAASAVAIVLAAGRSERLGGDKLLQLIDGTPMIERTVGTFVRAPRVADVLVVVRPEDRERFAWLWSPRVHVVPNPDADRGMITSIRRGLESTWAQERDFLIHPADVPFVKPEVVDAVLRELVIRSAKIVIPVYRGLGGHPGAFSAAIRDDFFRHGDQNGARDVLLRHRAATTRWNARDPDVCFDVDTPEDLRIAADPGARWARVERDVEERETRRR